MSEWSKEHAWKVCVLQKGTKGSNPFLSAIYLFSISCEVLRNIFSISWRDVRVVEGARLESVCTPKGYQGFESLSLRYCRKVWF